MIRIRSGTGLRTTVVLALMLAVSACSSGSSDDTSNDTTTTGANATTTAGNSSGGDTTSTTATPDDNGSSGEGDVNRGTVTVGDQSWTFDFEQGLVATCDPDLFGSGIFAVGYEVDADGNLVEGGAGVNMKVPPADWEAQGFDPPSIDVNAEDENDWETGYTEAYASNFPDLTDLQNVVVTSWVLDNGYAKGEATFVREESIYMVIGGSADELEIVDGTFEIRCPTG